MEEKGRVPHEHFVMVLKNAENSGGNMGGKEHCELRACHLQKV